MKNKLFEIGKLADKNRKYSYIFTSIFWYGVIIGINKISQFIIYPIVVANSDNSQLGSFEKYASLGSFFSMFIGLQLVSALLRFYDESKLFVSTIFKLEMFLVLGGFIIASIISDDLEEILVFGNFILLPLFWLILNYWKKRNKNRRIIVIIGLYVGMTVGLTLLSYTWLNPRFSFYYIASFVAHLTLITVFFPYGIVGLDRFSTAHVKSVFVYVLPLIPLSFYTWATSQSGKLIVVAYSDLELLGILGPSLKVGLILKLFEQISKVSLLDALFSNREIKDSSISWIYTSLILLGAFMLFGLHEFVINYFSNSSFYISQQFYYSLIFSTALEMIRGVYFINSYKTNNTWEIGLLTLLSVLVYVASFFLAITVYGWQVIFDILLVLNSIVFLISFFYQERYSRDNKSRYFVLIPLLLVLIRYAAW